MKKESAFKMKGFSGFGNSPLKKTPPKSTRKDTLRAVSGFEADFPKITQTARVFADVYSPKKNLNRAKKYFKAGAKEYARIGKKAINYFKAK